MAYARSVQGVWNHIEKKSQYYNECNIPTQKDYAFYVHKFYTSGGTLLLSLNMIKTPPSPLQESIKFVVNLQDVIDGVPKTGIYNASISTNGGQYSIDVRTVSGMNLTVTGYAFSCPVFSDQSAIDKYIATGDDSGRELNVNTIWNLYIDGTKNPLYKLTWKCVDIPNSDTSKIKVMFCAQDAITNTYIVKDTKYYDYNDKSVKLNYHDIHEAVWGDSGGLVKGAVTIIVQFEYFDTTTVVPKDTSSYM